MLKKIVTNVSIYLILLVIYTYLFGQISIRKYIDDAVIVTSHEEKSAGISPPGKGRITPPFNYSQPVVHLY